MKFLTALFFVLLTSGLAAQALNISADLTNATCQANGAVTVNVTGGSDDYRFTLTNTCGGNFPPQNTPTFTTLEPCDYTVEVVDRITGEIATFSFVISGVNDPLEAVVVFSGCDGMIVISGGNGPYEVSYTTTAGTVELNTAQTQIDLPPLDGSDVNGTVIDACGNSRNFSGQGTATAIQNFSRDANDSTLVFTPNGGEAPYTFTMQSSFGMFTNQTGIFPWQEIGCNAMISIGSACAGGELNDAEVGVELEMRWGCVNFAEGYAELVVIPPGRGPYTYEINADGQTFTQTDSVFTGLPVNAETYVATVTDVCGISPRFNPTITRYQMDILGEADGCTDNTIAVRVDRQCSGPLFTPISIACQNCSGDDTLTLIQVSRGDTTFLTGQTPGNWDISMEDSCGDRMRCQDEVILEAISACDSIVANLVQLLTCDNGTFSRRVINEPTVVYTLEDAAGNVLESGNTTGRFTGVGPGTFLVRAQSDCGTLSASAVIGDPVAIDPFFDFFPRFDRDEEGNCQMTYGIRLQQLEGPFVLTGGPEGLTYELFNDFGQDNCDFFDNEVILVPGDYTLTSFGSCGSVDFTLPEIEEPRIDSVAILSTCPGETLVEVFSTFRTNGDYRSWFLDQGIRIGTSSNLGDYYYVNETIYRQPDFIEGLAPGEYRLAIVPRFSRGFCPVDTFTFVIPEYQPVALDIEGDILCDTSGTVPLQLFPMQGNGPYVLREVDCDDPANVLATYNVEIGEAADVPVVSIGAYCFVVEDICGVTADFQVEVRGLSGNIDVSYDCAPTLILSTDTLPGTFQWMAEDGTPLGNDATLRTPPPATDTEYILEVDIGTCILREVVPVMARPIIPGLDILQPVSGEVVQCDTDTVMLIAATDTFSIITWDEPFTGDTLVTQQNGLRQVVATNDLGCVTQGEVLVRRVISPDPMIGPEPNFCFGDTLNLGIDGRGTDGQPLADINWSSGAFDTDSILISGTDFYAVSVTDIDGCSGLDTFTFVEPGLVQYQLEIDSVSCFNARDAVVNVVSLAGGTPAFTFDLNGIAYIPGDPIDGLDIGEYRFRATDSHGCFLDSLFRIGEPDSLSVFIGDSRLVKLGEVIEIPLATNADTLTLVEWFTANPLLELREDLARITSIQTDSIRIRITDQLGCVATNSFRLTVDRGALVYVPNAFSPNGDGVNDRFIVQGERSQITNISTLQVFDRWGNQHFGATDLGANDFGNGWDGMLDGRQAPVGIYVWVAEVMLVNGDIRLLKGEVSLLR